MTIRFGFCANKFTKKAFFTVFVKIFFDHSIVISQCLSEMFNEEQHYDELS